MSWRKKEERCSELLSLGLAVEQERNAAQNVAAEEAARRAVAARKLREVEEQLECERSLTALVAATGIYSRIKTNTTAANNGIEDGGRGRY